MKTFFVYEGFRTVEKELEQNHNITIGDTIEYITYNQMGWKKYIVQKENNIKILQLIDSYHHKMGLYDS